MRKPGDQEASEMGWSPDQLAKMNSLYVRGWIMDYNKKYVAT